MLPAPSSMLPRPRQHRSSRTVHLVGLAQRYHTIVQLLMGVNSIDSALWVRFGLSAIRGSVEASARNLLNRRCRDGSITRSILQSFLADGIGILTNSDFASAMQNEEHLFVYTMIVKGKRTFAGWHGGDVARHTIDLKPALRSVSRQGPAAGQCWANASRFRSASQGGRIPISWRMKLPVPCNRFGRIDRIPGRSDRKWRP